MRPGNLELQRGQDTHDLIRRHLDPQDAGRVGRIELDHPLRLSSRVQVTDDRDDSATAQLRHQVSRPRRRLHRHLRVHPSPKPLARFALQPQQAGGAANVEEIEVRCLQENIGRGFGDLALQSSHHATDSHGAAPIGDEQHLIVEGAQLAIECRHLLAGPGAAHDNRRQVIARLGSQGVIVEGVQRLPQLQHHVVGDVHDVADGPHPGQAQSHLHPEG